MNIIVLLVFSGEFITLLSVNRELALEVFLGRRTRRTFGP
jgi:hypothetical protein